MAWGKHVVQLSVGVYTCLRHFAFSLGASSSNTRVNRDEDTDFDNNSDDNDGNNGASIGVSAVAITITGSRALDEGRHVGRRSELRLGFQDGGRGGRCVRLECLIVTCGMRLD